MVAPDHRNRGLVAKIMQATADGLADRGTDPDDWDLRGLYADMY